MSIHNLSWGKSIIKHGKWYFLSSLFTKGLNFLLLPVYTEYLSPADYGILGTITSITGLLPFFISLYLDAAFVRFFFDEQKKPDGLSKMFSTVYFFVLLWGIFVVAITLILFYFGNFKFLPVPVYPILFIAFIPVIFNQIGLLGINYLRRSLLAKQTTIIECSSVIISILITLYLFIAKGYGYEARLWGAFFSSFALFIFYTIYFVKNKLLVFTFDFKRLKNYLIYSIPLLPNLAGIWLQQLSDRIIMTKYITMEALGIYTFAFTVAQILYFVQDAITQTVSPISMSGLIHDKENTKRKMAKMQITLFVIMSFCVVMLSLFTKEAVYVFVNERYHSVYTLVAILATVYIMQAQYRLFSEIISYTKKTWVISSGAVLMGAVSIILNFILIPKYGYWASAFIAPLSMSVYLAWIYKWAQHYEKIQINFKLNIVILLIFLVYFIAGICISLYLPFNIFTFLLKIFIALTLVLIIYIANKKCYI